MFKKTEKVVEDFIYYAKENNLDDFRECFTERRLYSKKGPELNMLVVRNHYQDETYKIKKTKHEIENYGKDLEEIVWIEHPNGKFHEVKLINEDGWKINEISFCNDVDEEVE